MSVLSPWPATIEILVVHLSLTSSFDREAEEDATADVGWAAVSRGETGGRSRSLAGPRPKMRGNDIG
jgi:hypothetical protein